MKKVARIAATAFALLAVLGVIAYSLFSDKAGCSIEHTAQLPFDSIAWQLGDHRVRFTNSLLAQLPSQKRADVEALLGSPLYDGTQVGNYLTYLLLDRRWPECGPISSRLLMDVWFDSNAVVSRVTVRHD